MHPGSLSEQYNVCGKPGCRCNTQEPQKHGPYCQLSFTWRGKGRTRFVRAERLAEVRQKIANYKRFRELTDEWVTWWWNWSNRSGSKTGRTMEIDPHNLPSEVNVLQQIVLQLLQAVEDKDQLLARVQHQLAQLLRYRYGQSRERIDENQLFLFAAQIIAGSRRASAALSSEEDSSPRADRHEKKEKSERRGHGRRPLPESLERRRVVFDLDESQRQCQHCHTPMQKIGEDVSERLEFIPASLLVIEEVRSKYACAKGCGVAAAEKPAAPIEKGLSRAGSVGTRGRQQIWGPPSAEPPGVIFERHGVQLSRKTMCDWMAACARRSWSARCGSA